MPTVVINFRLGNAHILGESDSFRLVVDGGAALHVEVECRDRLGATSWRPAKVDASKVVPRVLSQALIKSQLTLVQRITKPMTPHPEDITWDGDTCFITIGQVKL
jgi:hypothetical protein